MWTITKDHIADPGAKPGSNCNAVGKVGPRDCKLTAAEIIAHPNAQKFKMYDDDGELYYEGVNVEDDSDEYSEGGFDPLNHFGMPNAGATRIDYKNAEGQWEPL